VLHGVIENFGFIPAGDAFLLAGIYGAATLVVFLLCRWYYRNTVKAALMSAFIMVVYLFFGAIHDFLLRHLPFIGKYSVLLTLLLVLLLTAGYRLKRAGPLLRLVLLLNIVFGLYMLIDGVQLGARLIHPPANKLAIQRPGYAYLPVQQAQKPDIYFLIFDEYASSLALQQNYGYHNTLDSLLEAQQFHVQPKSYSNYSFTPLSTASILNMSYLRGLQTGDTISVPDFNYCLSLIKNNEVIRFLSELGYDIKNYSTFDLAGAPATSIETLLPLKTKLITSNTLLSRMTRDMAWVFFKGPLAKWFYDPFNGARRINKKILDDLQEQSARKGAHPVFVYGHIYMPHGPYLYDSAGRLNEPRFAVNPDSAHKPGAYLGYLAYANKEIMKLVTAIRHNTQNKAAIILMGDHGFRYHEKQYLHQNYQNLNAVYLPGGDYHQLYDSITCVNQFRTVLNSLFGQSIPLLKDSTVFLTGMQ